MWHEQAQRDPRPVHRQKNRDQMSVNNVDLSRILSLIIGILMDPYDQFIDRLLKEGRVTEEEVGRLREALSEQIPRLSQLVKPQQHDDGTV